MSKWVQHVHGHEAYLAMGDLGTAAIRAHESQASPYDDLPEDLQLEFLASDRRRLVRGDDVLARRPDLGQAVP